MSGEPRIRIQWTDTAKKCLEKLPRKVRRRLLEKADALRECDDPRNVHKPLRGPLRGLYRITYARYRAVYRVVDEELPQGHTVTTIIVQFVAAGIRKERSQEDIYRVAEKLIESGCVELSADDDDDQGEED